MRAGRQSQSSTETQGWHLTTWLACGRPPDQYAPHQCATGRPAKFEIFDDKGGKYHFHLKAPNGEIIVASQAYATKANAHKGIDAIKKHAADAKVEDLTGITRSSDL